MKFEKYIEDKIINGEIDSDDLEQKILTIDKDTLESFIKDYIFNPKYLTRTDISFNLQKEDHEFNFLLNNAEYHYLPVEYIISVLKEACDNKLVLKSIDLRRYPYPMISLLGLSFNRHFGFDLFFCGSYEKETSPDLSYFENHRFFKHFYIEEQVYSGSLVMFDKLTIYHFSEKYELFEFFNNASEVDFRYPRNFKKGDFKKRRSIFFTSFPNLAEHVINKEE